jgi:hypothetical protein
MKSVADLLREGDPVASDAELPAGDIRRMRQLVLAHHAGAGAPPGGLWRGITVLASIVLAAFTLGTWLADARIDEPGRPAPTAAGRSEAGRSEAGTAPEPLPARQVQFVTPRGTRVVWVLQIDTPGQEGIR